MTFRFPNCVSLLCILSFAASSAVFGQTLYTTDGEPSGIEEEIRWHLNRGRFDTASENARRGTTYMDVPATAGPFAPHQSITLAARRHSEDMAKSGLFQHQTVPGSAYYDPITQPSPFDRMKAEGYTWTQAAENIAAGYPGAEQVYMGWWNSQPHRAGMYNAGLREIGNGYFFWNDSPYKRYYTMDLGTAGNSHFFTDTLFQDADADGMFTQQEAVANVAVRLLINSVPHTFYDVSTAAGSFAIPIQTIPSGDLIQVSLSNASPTSVSLSIPRDAQNYEQLLLAAGESRLYGQVSKPSASRNLGWRDVAPLLSPPARPSLLITQTAEGIVLEWTSDERLEYRPEASSDLHAWTPLASDFVPGTSSGMRYVEAPDLTRRFYRLQVQPR